MSYNLDNILNTADSMTSTNLLKSLQYYKYYISNSERDNNNSNNQINTKYVEDKVKHLIDSNIDNIDESYSNMVVYNDEQTNEIFNLINNGDMEEFKNKYIKYNHFLFYKNGITPLHYAIKNGDSSFAILLLNLGGKIDTVTKSGITLFEYAFIKNDPNMMDFLIKYGANVVKHNKLRSYKNITNLSNEIDIALLYAYIIFDNPVNYDYRIKHMNWVFRYLNDKDIDKIKIFDNNIDTYTIIKHIDNIINTLKYPEEYLLIISEELEYELNKSLACPLNRIQLLLYYLIPFINYKDPIILQWLLILEIRYSIKQTMKNSMTEFKKNLKDKLNNDYSNILTRHYIQVLLNIIFNNKKIC